jgi:hypothetical protein
MELPFSTFFAVHLEVGGDTKSLKYQERFWPALVSLVNMAEQYNSRLTLQFNPQWAEYILMDKDKLNLLKQWQKQGHEVALHHHGYDHNDWNGYTNRIGKNNDPRHRGNVKDMMKLMTQLILPYKLLSGTITDEEFDCPKDIKYDTEGIRINHARSKPQKVVLGGNEVIQVSMALLSFDGDIKSFKQEYLKSEKNDIFGVVTHEYDFYKNPKIIEEWLKFIKAQGGKIQSVSNIIVEYQNAYKINHSDNPLIFSNDIAV